MTTLFTRSRPLVAMLASLALLACSPMKDSAEAALADANSAVQKVAPDAQKYAPVEFATVNEQVAAMKAAFDKKDYETVLNSVHKLGPSLMLLGETISSKKGEERIKLRDQWASAARDVPKSLAAVEARIAELGKARKLPKGVTKEAVAGAGATVDAAKQGWSDAESAQKAANMEDAVAKGKAAQAKLTELMASLAMEAPSAPAK